MINYFFSPSFHAIRRSKHKEHKHKHREKDRSRPRSQSHVCHKKGTGAGAAATTIPQQPAQCNQSVCSSAAVYILAITNKALTCSFISVQQNHRRLHNLSNQLASRCSLHSCISSSDFDGGAGESSTTSYTTSLSTDTLYWDQQSDASIANSRQQSIKSRQSYNSLQHPGGILGKR